MQTIVLASHNQGKINEFNQLLNPFDWQVVPQSDLGISAIDEPFNTFMENALHKARHASQCSNLPALADDSGLCVYALDGKPGIHSARFARTVGLPPTENIDQQNNQLLLEQLSQTTDRRAFFYCLIVYLTHANDPCPIFAQGFWHGNIALSPSGCSGFGYDPIFIPNGFTISAAELTATQKNQLSHRAQALSTLRNQVQSIQR